jgi:formylglycine-generating enzyme required for sulfatase activity
MNDPARDFRASALQRLIKGEITQAEYEQLLARIDEMYAPPPRVQEPSYVPDLADREKGTLAGIPIPPALKPGTLLDKYELKSSKRGGMGEVWRAFDAKADRWVAVKLLPQELRGNTAEIARIRSQFKLVEQLDHPHICRLFDLNEHPVWGWYEVMRWIDGETLAEIATNAGGKLPYERVVRLLWPVSRALDHAHARNVLHRDIKPLNIMEDGEGKVHVIDFGLAAEVRGSLSRVSRKFDGLSGTPQYLAPELWNEAPESPRSDQYALGVTAYELLAGRPPFKTDNLAILMARTQTAEVPAIASIPEGAMSVLRRALAKERKERFASCAEFVKALANPPQPSARTPAPVIRAQAASPVSPPSKPTTSSGSQPSPLKSPFSKTEAEAGQRAWASYLGREVYEKNSLGMELALIPPGSFEMGSPKSDKERRSNEDPVSVTLTRPYWLGRTEVTRKQWKGVMGTEPWRSQSGTEDHPATEIWWEDASAFCRKLSGVREGSGWTYRLPTEAEWEWACRGGTLTAFWFGNELNGRQANCDGNSPYGTSQKGPYKQGTTAVGSYGANPFGLWDMHGNVWEWCADWYQQALPGGENPEVTSGGWLRVIRGGSWRDNAVFCRSAYRYGDEPGYRDNNLGFRVLAALSRAGFRSSRMANGLAGERRMSC